MDWREFEHAARLIMGKYFGVALWKGKIEGNPKTFDFMSGDKSIVGDAKFYKHATEAKRAAVSEYVWLLEKTGAKVQFLVFPGASFEGDLQQASEWIDEYGKLTQVRFYAIEVGGEVRQLHGPSEPLRDA